MLCNALEELCSDLVGLDWSWIRVPIQSSPKGRKCQIQLQIHHIWFSVCLIGFGFGSGEALQSNPSKSNPKGLQSNKITVTIRCGPCGLLNPRHPKLVERARTQPSPGTEIIEIKDSPGGPRSTPLPSDAAAEQDIKPARRRGLATHIPSLPDL